MNSVRMGLSLLLLLVLPAGAQEKRQQDRQIVLLAARRAGRVEAFDPATLVPLGSIRVLPMADGISHSPDGTILYIPEGTPPGNCCSLYALDLETMRMSPVAEPASGATISPDGSYVITQRGAIGVEIYGSRTLVRESHISESIAPGAYQLSFSPDGRLLLGLSDWKGPMLDIFDFASRNLVRRYRVDANWPLSGAWVEGKFYLYAHRGPEGKIWKVDVESPVLAAPVAVNFPDVNSRCEIHDETVLGAGNQLFVYELFGMKGDRRDGCKTSIPGSVLSVDPETGRVLRRLAESIHFNSIVASPDGQQLYGIDVRHANWGSVGLIRLDAHTGRILAQRELAPDVWSIDLAPLPHNLVPHSDLEVTLN